MSQLTSDLAFLSSDDIDQNLLNHESEVDVGIIHKPDYSDDKVQNHKTQFETWLHEHYEKENTSYVLKQKDYEEIRDVLKGVRNCNDPQKRFALKKKKYLLIDDIVHRQVEDGTVKQVVYLEQFFEIIYDQHCIKRNHQGIQKTFEQLLIKYVGITREIVSKFRHFCYICDLKPSQRTQDFQPPIVYQRSPECSLPKRYKNL